MKKNYKGFSLIELSVVLLAAGILATVGVQSVTAMVINSRYAQMRGNFETIKGAILWKIVQTRQCLPPQVLPCNAATYTYTLPTSGTTLTAMGFNAQTANDPWGRPYTYVSTMIPQPATISPPPAVLLPGTEVFVIRSFGPDGTGGNADDITQSMYVIELQGALSRF